MNRVSRRHSLARGGFALALVAVLALAGCGKTETTYVNNVLDPTNPFDAEWRSSGHADASAPAFTQWDLAGSIETRCAKCHSTEGFHDFLGADGTAAGTVENPAPVGTLVNCQACHADAAWALDAVTFPSGVTVTGLGHEAICYQCHQGLSSSDAVDAHIGSIADDTVDPVNLRFQHDHYFQTSVSLFGGIARGGYQYPGRTFQGRLRHADGFLTCIDCHDKHTLKPKVGACARCHEGVASLADIRAIRMAGSFLDPDGDGDTSEGIRDEVHGLQAVLLGAMQSYAAAVSDPIVFDGSLFPNFFVDDGDGVPEPAEIVFENRYLNWTPRLIRAAYNYYYTFGDPCAYIHNPKYVLEILYDSIADLESHASVTVPGFANLNRDFGGHFSPVAEAFRHWDGEGQVPPDCARCHTPEGFLYSLNMGGMEPLSSLPPSRGLSCETCHTGTDFFAGSAPRHSIARVTFPGGASVTTNSHDDSMLCLTCHQGRVSKADIDAALAGFAPANDDAAIAGAAFLNVHYLPAGAVQFGADAGVGYEYAGQTYAARDAHNATASMRACTYCHQGGGANGNHGFFVSTAMPTCTTICHTEAASGLPADITKDTTNYDSDGTTTTVKATVDAFAARLYAAMQEYAVENAATAALVYDGSTYPYFFVDTNGNGSVDTGENVYANRYATWTARLLKAAHNYQLVQKDPGAWAHNHRYVLALLYDSIFDLNGQTSTNWLNQGGALQRP